MRSQGGQNKCYKDTLISNPEGKGADDYEAKRVCEAEPKRKERKKQSQEIIIRVVIFRIYLLYLQKTVHSKDWPDQP